MTISLTVIKKKQRNICGTVTRLFAGRSGFRMPAGATFQKVQTGSGAHQTSYSMSTGVHSRQTSTRALNLTTHRLGPKIRKSGVIPPPLTCLRGVDADNFTFSLTF